jgi:D-alanine-D-alanine ligase
MHIGLTYDLRADYLAMGHGAEETAEFDRPDTIDALAGALERLGHTTDRIGHLRQLIARLSGGDRWDLVFNVAEGLRGVGREAQVPALLDAYDIPYTFSDPLVLALTLHKAMTKRVLRDLGLKTADFALVEREADVDRNRLPFPLFAKPVAEGTAKGINAESKIRTHAALRSVCGRLLREYRQPVLVETYLGGREFTTGVVGTGEQARCLGTIEVELLAGAEPDAYTYVNKERCEELCRYTLAPQEWARRCEALALVAWRGLGCRDAGRVDLRADASGELHILELNPLAGLHPEHSDLPIICNLIGLPYLELIRTILASAQERLQR